MSIIVKVHYHDFEGGGSKPSYQHVANVRYEGEKGVEEALEYAWALCQNIDGSWSRGPELPNGAKNPDWSPAVQVIAPLPKHNGVYYGHRSSMVGDVMQIDGEGEWKVAGCGFKACDGELPA
jgi:hypothetical protein